MNLPPEALPRGVLAQGRRGRSADAVAVAGRASSLFELAPLSSSSAASSAASQVVPAGHAPSAALARGDRARLCWHAGGLCGGEPVDGHLQSGSPAPTHALDPTMTLTVVAVVTPVPSAVMLVACVPVGRVRGVSAAVLVLVACVPTTLIVVGVLAVLAAARLVVTAAAT